MSQIYTWIFIVLYSGCILQSEATRCFACTGVPYPFICTKIITCGADEVCSTEQVVTISGHVVYNTGCQAKHRCPSSIGSLLGRRDFNITTISSTDISSCIECCSEDFCNNKGCGADSVPLGQRGPYCYNCDAVLDPSACEHVAVCQTNEECMLYTPTEYNGLPETVYRSQCENKLGCSVLGQAFGHYRCLPLCCGTDFCNDHCGTTLSTRTPFPSVAITTPQVTSSTTNTNSSTSQSRCEQGGFIYLHNNNAHLCVHIVTGHGMSWRNARSHCEKEHHGRLVVLDTHEKALLMRQKLQADFSGNEGYWIGGEDERRHSQFSWVNGNHFIDQNSDWDVGQPIRIVDGKHYDCVAMWRASAEPFKWHADYCVNMLAFICEHL